ncbi:MAG: hypothetical protein Q8N18_17070 [Opitutaceae bacterium]|nr:hypothetical protein [Opitutaceae bacterium]
MKTEFSKEIADILRRKRGYADYFHFGDDKPGTECGVVLDWLHARYGNGEERFTTMEFLAPPLDPPDVILVDHESCRHGLEVTELVDHSTLAAHIKHQSLDWKEYEETELSRLIVERIGKKDGKPFRNGPFFSKTLLIYSDEPAIAGGEGAKFLGRFPRVSSAFFDEIWFVIPPETSPRGAVFGLVPEENNCRIYQLK